MSAPTDRGCSSARSTRSTPSRSSNGSPRGPFISPDGQWVGFVDSNTTLKKVAITGGPSLTLARVDSPRGATWAPDDTVIVATINPATGLLRVSAGGGTPTILTRPDRAQGEADHVWPELLPGGRAVLFTVTAVAGGPDAAQVVVMDLTPDNSRSTCGRIPPSHAATGRCRPGVARVRSGHPAAKSSSICRRVER